MHFAVCGLHLSNGVLNYQLAEVGATLLRTTKSSSNYTMHALSSPNSPSKPGMVYHPLGSSSCSPITLEIWDIPDAAIGPFLKNVPSPLAFGTVLLADGERVYGFVCESWASDPAAASTMGITTEDITCHGGWREWLASKTSA